MKDVEVYNTRGLETIAAGLVKATGTLGAVIVIVRAEGVEVAAALDEKLSRPIDRILEEAARRVKTGQMIPVGEHLKQQ